MKVIGYWKSRLHLFAFTSLCAALLLLLPGICLADRGATSHNSQALGKGPKPGLKPLDKEGKMRISENDRCPVCAMRPLKYPKTSCAIQLKDGRTFYFCATGCMIRSWMHPEAYLGADKNELDRPVVREYFTGRETDARNLKWIAGSDIVGPMGPALVPVQGEREVETFRRRHGGRAVFTLEELNDQRWREITGKLP